MFNVLVVDSRSNQGTGTVTVFVGTEAPPVAGSVEAGAGGGGGGGGCEARRERRSTDPAGLLWILVWLALVARRATRRAA